MLPGTHLRQESSSSSRRVTSFLAEDRLDPRQLAPEGQLKKKLTEQIPDGELKNGKLDGKSVNQ